MGIYLADQAMVFLESILVGAALGLLYDVFRITRIAFKTPDGVIFAEDVLFFLVCALTTFFFGLSTIDGMLRVFLVAGELIGAILYFYTLGQLVMGVARKLIEAVKATLRFLLKWILMPILRLFYSIIRLIARPFLFLFKKFKKMLQKAKFRLKVRRKVLYNQLRGFTGKKRAARMQKKAKKRAAKKQKRTKKHEKTQTAGA